MFLKYLIAGYYTSVALCAPQNPWLASRSSAVKNPWLVSESGHFNSSSTVSSETSAETASQLVTLSSPSGETPVSALASETSQQASSTISSPTLATQTSALITSSSASATHTCAKLPKGMRSDWNPPAGYSMRPGPESECLFNWLSTRSLSQSAAESAAASTTPERTAASLRSTSQSRAAPSTGMPTNPAASPPRAPPFATRPGATRSTSTRSTATKSTTEATAVPKALGDGKSLWNPKITDKRLGPTFQIILSAVPNLKDGDKRMVPDVDIYDIDLFRTEKKTIDIMKKMNKTVVCYFSGGTYEPSRPDSNQFTRADKGSRLAQWPSEMWVRTQSTTIRQIMTNRIQLARQKGCDAIDPDNIDAYGSGAGGGLGLTKKDSINYVQFLVTTAAKYNLAVGLKNSLEILPDVRRYVHFAVNEECVKANECEKYTDFLTKENKPVFHIEYPTNDRPRALSDTDRQRWCGGRTKSEVKNNLNFQTVIKTMSLGGWVQYCNGTQATTPVHDTPSRFSGGKSAFVAPDEEPKISELEARIALEDGYPFPLDSVELVQVGGDATGEENESGFSRLRRASSWRRRRER